MCAMEMATDQVVASAPDGWVAVELDSLPGELRLDGLGVSCVNPEQVDGFASSLFIASSPGLPPDLAVWMSESLTGLEASIPGFRVIDDQGWAEGTWVGAYRCGTYIMENTAVTTIQWACVGERSTVSLTGTCSSREFGKRLPEFVDVATSMKERCVEG